MSLQDTINDLEAKLIQTKNEIAKLETKAKEYKNAINTIKELYNAQTEECCCDANGHIYMYSKSDGKQIGAFIDSKAAFVYLKSIQPELRSAARHLNYAAEGRYNLNSTKKGVNHHVAFGFYWSNKKMNPLEVLNDLKKEI